MLHLLFNLLLVSLGAVLGIVTLCLLQAGSKFDKDMEELERKKKL